MSQSIPGDRWTATVVVPDPNGQPFWDRVLAIGDALRHEEAQLRAAITGAADPQAVRNLRKRLARRIVREGYPKISPFETAEEIDQYLSGSPKGHVCLICGNAYKGLGLHLANLHKVDLDEYRDQYRLPHTFGLCSDDSKEKYRANLIERIASGQWRLQGSTEQAAKARSGKANRPKEAESPYKRLVTRQRQQQFEDADYWRALDLMRAESVSLASALAHPGMPSLSAFRHWKAQSPERQQAFEDQVEQLPFPVQADMHMLGARYNQTLLALRRQGKTIDEIADITQTHRVSVNDRLKRLDPQHRPIVRRGPRRTTIPKDNE